MTVALSPLDDVADVGATPLSEARCMMTTMTRTFALAVAALFTVYHNVRAQEPEKDPPCLEYKPVQVQLLGHLERISFPGDPTYIDNQGKEQSDAGFYLRLAHAICTNAKEGYDARKGVSLIEMVLDSTTLAAMIPNRDKEVTLHGSLLPAAGPGHHSPLLMVPVLPVVPYTAKP